MLVALTRAPCGLTSQLPKERESHFGADHLGATGDVQVLARAVVGVGLERDLSCNARSVQIVASKLAGNKPDAGRDVSVRPRACLRVQRRFDFVRESVYLFGGFHERS